MIAWRLGWMPPQPLPSFVAGVCSILGVHICLLAETLAEGVAGKRPESVVMMLGELLLCLQNVHYQVENYGKSNVSHALHLNGVAFGLVWYAVVRGLRWASQARRRHEQSRGPRHLRQPGSGVGVGLAIGLGVGLGLLLRGVPLGVKVRV